MHKMSHPGTRLGPLGLDHITKGLKRCGPAPTDPVLYQGVTFCAHALATVLKYMIAKVKSMKLIYHDRANFINF